MSTKRLSKTVIEGGRRPYNKFDRNQSHKDERADVRAYLGKAMADDEYSEAKPLEKRRKVRKEFNDKLGPVYRWLRRQVGRKWDEVNAEIRTTYDTRNLASQHIVFDHLISSVQTSLNADDWRSYDFVVDDDGVLQLSEINRWNRKAYYRNKNERHPGDWIRVSHQELQNWAGYRKIIDYGEVQFWTREPTRMEWRTCYHNHNCFYGRKLVGQIERTTYKTIEDAPTWGRYGLFLEKNGVIYKRVNQWVCFQPSDRSFAQGKKFSKEEAEFWKKLHPDYRALLTMIKDK